MKPTAIPTLDDLAENPGLSAALPPDLARILYFQVQRRQAALARLQEALALRVLDGGEAGCPGQRSGGDRLLTVAEAARKLGLSRDYLYRHSHSFPFSVRLGRKLRFSERGIDKYIRQRAGR